MRRRIVAPRVVVPEEGVEPVLDHLRRAVREGVRPRAEPPAQRRRGLQQRDGHPALGQHHGRAHARDAAPDDHGLRARRNARRPARIGGHQHAGPHAERRGARSRVHRSAGCGMGALTSQRKQSSTRTRSGAGAARGRRMNDERHDRGRDDEPRGDQHRHAEPGVERDRVVVGAARDARDARDDRHGQQPGGAGHGVVHPGCRSGEPVGGRVEHGGGERRDRERHPRAEDDHRGQHVGEPRRVGPDAQQEQQPARGHQGPDGHRQPWPDAPGQRAHARREQEHDHRERQQGRARGHRAEARHGLQLQDQHEEHDAQRPVDEQRGGVGRAEHGVGEERGRHERVPRAHLDQHEGDQRDHARGRGAQPDRGDPVGTERGEPPGEQAQPERAEDRAGHVEPRRRLLVAAFRHVAERDDDDQRRERDVDQEDGPPRPLDEPSAEERADGARDPAEARPGAHRRRAVGPVERGGDEGEAPGCEQRAADALQRPRRDQDLGGGGQAAGERRQREPRHADEEDPLAAEVVAERATEQDQRRQRQRVGVDRPLQIAEPGVEVVPDARQRHVDDRAVDHHDPGAEHGGREHPPARRRAHAQPTRLGHGRTLCGGSDSGRGCVPATECDARITGRHVRRRRSLLRSVPGKGT